MSDWADYQERAAEFFRGLGFEAEVNASVEGVRSTHEVDVWVTFTRFALEHLWYVECKFWNGRVPKEKVEVATDLSERIRNLYVFEGTLKGGTARPRPGVDSARHMWMFTRAITVRDAARSARFAKFPTLIGWGSPEGDNPVRAQTASDVIEQGGVFLDEAQEWLLKQEDAVAGRTGNRSPD